MKSNSAVVYIRAMSEHGKETQRKFIEQQVAGSEFTVTQTILDTSSSVDAFSRPGLVQLLETVKSSGVKSVIVDNPTRLSRRITEVRQIVHDLTTMGVQVYYAEDGLGSTLLAAEMARFVRNQTRLSQGKRIRNGKQLKQILLT